MVGRMHAWNCTEMSPLRADARLCDMLRPGETCRCHMALLVRSALVPPRYVGLCIKMPVKLVNRTCRGLCAAANKIVQRL